MAAACTSWRPSGFTYEIVSLILALYGRDIFGKLHVNVGVSRESRQNGSVVSGCSGMDGLIFSGPRPSIGG